MNILCIAGILFLAVSMLAFLIMAQTAKHEETRANEWSVDEILKREG